jgi:hypothetical protein
MALFLNNDLRLRVAFVLSEWKRGIQPDPGPGKWFRCSQLHWFESATACH